MTRCKFYFCLFARKMCGHDKGLTETKKLGLFKLKHLCPGKASNKRITDIYWWHTENANCRTWWI